MVLSGCAMDLPEQNNYLLPTAVCQVVMYFNADREVVRMNKWKCLRGSSFVDHEIAEKTTFKMYFFLKSKCRKHMYYLLLTVEQQCRRVAQVSRLCMYF